MLRRWKFTVLLVALLILLVGFPMTSGYADIRVLYEVLVVVVFLSALPILFRRRRSFVLGLLLGTTGVGGILCNYSLQDTSPLVSNLLFHLLPALFLGFTVFNVVRTIFVEAVISTDSINGAFCGYLLIGLAFGHLYCLCETFWPGSFHLQPQVGSLPEEGHQRHQLLTYFSLITLTTVGYGDITPLTPPARSIAWVEAVIGQFYITVIIAELISLKVSAAFQERRDTALAPESPRQSS